MTRKLERDRLRSEIESLSALLARIPSSSGIMRISYETRRAELERALKDLDEALDTTAHATIFFGGRRVQGSEAIDAEFAADSLKAFQALVVAKAVKAQGAPLGQRGPLPLREGLRLSIAAVARGSFGFVLEESAPLGKPMFASALKEALSEATDVISDFASPDEARYSALLEGIDFRVLVQAKNFFKILRDAEASVRIVEGDRERLLDQSSVNRAFERADKSDVEEEDFTQTGVLVGLTPVSGWFEFRFDGSSIHIRGRTGPQLSRDFLERIEQEGLALGGRSRWKASLRRRTVRKPSGETRDTYTLLDLSDGNSANE